MHESLIDYYSQRADEYEEIYQRDDPARQAELRRMEEIIRETFRGRRVLEVACGTGFWTRIVVEVATEVVAIDASGAMLEVGRQNLNLPPHPDPLPRWGRENLRLEQGDAYKLWEINGEFDAGLANFWLSHVPRGQLQEFLEQFHRRVGHDAMVFMADNMNVPGVGGEFIGNGKDEDTYKIRQLKDGSSHKIIKNYYSESALKELLAPHAHGLEIHCGKAYWWVRYRVAAPGT